MTAWNVKARELLRKRNVSIADLADILDITPGGAGHYLSGRRQPKPGVLKKIAKAAGVSVSELIDDDPSFARNQQEHDVLEAFRNVPPHNIEAAIAMLRGLSDVSGATAEDEQG